MVAVIEEVAFRGGLTKFNPILFALSISTIVGLFFKKIVYRNMVFETHGLLEMFALILVVGGLTYVFAQKNREKLTLFWERNFGAIVVISAVLFGLIHFANSETLEPKFLVTTISQLIGGFTLTFIRIRSGLFWAILIHFCWNIMLGL